ncbi:hypothetical protein HRF87_18125 [Bacillus sp. CRN 9]|nr:hypothetical protein [Bacillus sp. CRN 9]
MEELSNTKGVSFNSNGTMSLPFQIQTSYSESDLTILFLNHYKCPFCNNTLEFTPLMMKVITKLFKKPYHLEFKNDLIEISTNGPSMTIPLNAGTSSIKSLLCSSGVKLENADEHLPSNQEVNDIYNLFSEFDSKSWNIRIESAYTDKAYVSSNGLWFNGI